MKKIAVVGAEESIGHEVLSFLADGAYPAENIIALEPRAPLGTQASYGEDDEIDVLNLDEYDFSGIDIAVFAAGEEISKRFVKKALDKGARVIDCIACFFSDSDVPMIIAGVNDAKLQEAKRGLVSVPSAAVTQILLPLVSVDKKYNIERMVWQIIKKFLKSKLLLTLFRKLKNLSAMKQNMNGALMLKPKKFWDEI